MRGPNAPSVEQLYVQLRDHYFEPNHDHPFTLTPRQDLVGMFDTFVNNESLFVPNRFLAELLSRATGNLISPPAPTYEDYLSGEEGKAGGFVFHGV